jgi:threonine/homoserine/homoserine lactone efflux protein
MVDFCIILFSLHLKVHFVLRLLPLLYSRQLKKVDRLCNSLRKILFQVRAFLILRKFGRYESYICSMPKLLKVFFWGMLISFLGCLPLGTLNVTAMQISLQEGINNALLFSFGCLLVEMLYVRLSLIGIEWVRKQVKLMRIMEWITLAIIIALATGSFIAAAKGGGSQKNEVLNNNMHRFLLGMLMSSISPAQVPFWFGWSTVLFQKGTLQTVKAQYNFYIVGIGLGTLFGNGVFIFGGRFIVQRIANSQAYLNWIIGGIFTITAVVQVIKMILHKDGVSRLEEGKL